MRDIQETLLRLSRSPFRSKFQLEAKELDYLQRTGMSDVLRHAAEFVEKRLASASPRNDGKQTPWRGHPVFVAQHATATCCRGCLQKWHKIARGRALTPDEKHYVVDLIGAWLSRQEGDFAQKRNASGRNSYP